MKKLFKISVVSLACLSVLAVIAYRAVTSGIEFGGNPLEDRANLLEQADNFSDQRFQNTVEQRGSNLWAVFDEYVNSQQRHAPKFPIAKPTFSEPAALGLRAVWFGHASVLVEIDGKRVFFDPMLSEAAFPVDVIAPKRMNPSPLSLDELPKIDAAVISHDHFDHLDMKTVQHLARQGAVIFAGLGVGAHLEKWGIPLEQIKEMNWGDSFELDGLRFNCTEARHYSGRKAMSFNTLWTSWLVQGPNHSVFHSGDTGYSSHFKNIGEQFKSIDLSLIKVGDYGADLAWQDIHMLPEDSVQAHLDIGAKLMLPIHWGVFALSYHPWDEPIERTITAAKDKNVSLAIPKIGESVVYGDGVEHNYWWRGLSDE